MRDNNRYVSAGKNHLSAAGVPISKYCRVVALRWTIPSDQSLAGGARVGVMLAPAGRSMPD